MKEKVFQVIRWAGTVLAFFNALMFFAMRPCWSGISSTLGYRGGSNTFLYFLPVFICVLLFVELLADLILKKIFKKNWLQIMFLAISLVFFAAIMVIIALGAIDYMRFVWPKFWVAVGVLAVLIALYLLLFVYPKTVLKDNKWFKFGTIGVASAVAVGLLVNFTVNWFVIKPVVYAVEDKYQIVFSTNAESTGWVEIGGKKYYDLYNGTAKTFTKIHKVEVPMSVLDEAKQYTVHSQKTIYAGPFGGFLGRDISEKVSFRPVDSSDGIQYLSFSDVHMNDARTFETASHAGNYDFLFLLGDIISDVETFDDANFNNQVAYGITKGQMPVVYARGNHDVKGRYSQELHKFVGAKGERFYYNFYFKDVYGLVLDLGEDHDDDWWEYYGTANFEEYRQEQIAFLKDEIAKEDYEAYPYRVVASHIPIPFVNYRHNYENTKKEMTALLNQMDFHMSVCGHQHQLMIFEPGLVTPETSPLTYNSSYKKGTYNGYLTNFNFPTFMVSKPGLTFGDPTNLSGAKSHIGLYVNVDLAGNKETCHYLNSRGEKVDTMNMFFDKAYGQQIVIDLTTKKFA
ncbi:MAG: hypothetical protein E7179_03480 [Erysipelotrichaceae bacterium]|jgi:predicted phosphodiesterase|nr:hypothetical protein [Erysipelotrichaceae bacterium]